jgi:5-oxoprolinase (ATP-hydrolysing)
MAAFEALTKNVNVFLKEQDSTSFKPMTMQEVAMGFVEVANEAMCRPIRSITQGKGYDTLQHVLASFGGAGGQHACAVAQSLGMSTVFIHRYSGILSAYGLALADVVYEAQEPCAKIYCVANIPYLDERIDILTEKCVSELKKQGFKQNEISTTPFLHMRYEGTDCPLMVTPQMTEINTDMCQHGNFEATFTHRYKQEFGFTIPDRSIIVDDVRVRGKGRASCQKLTPLPEAKTPPIPLEVSIEDTLFQCDAFHCCIVDRHVEGIGNGMIYVFYRRCDSSYTSPLTA